MNEADARERFATARVARLATVAAAGAPHLVPISFAMPGADLIVSAVDHKPKRTTSLQRLANIEANPRVALLADCWSEDWSQLWWVRADGLARVVAPGDAPQLRELALAKLALKYPQYAARPPSGAMIVVEVQRWSGWRASG